MSCTECTRANQPAASSVWKIVSYLVLWYGRRPSSTWASFTARRSVSCHDKACRGTDCCGWHWLTVPQHVIQPAIATDNWTGGAVTRHTTPRIDRPHQLLRYHWERKTRNFTTGCQSTFCISLHAAASEQWGLVWKPFFATTAARIQSIIVLVLMLCVVSWCRYVQLSRCSAPTATNNTRSLQILLRASGQLARPTTCLLLQLDVKVHYTATASLRNFAHAVAPRPLFLSFCL